MDKQAAKLIIRLAIATREMAALLLDGQDGRIEVFSRIINDAMKSSGLNEGSDLSI